MSKSSDLIIFIDEQQLKSAQNAKWIIHVDDSAKAWIIYRGNEEICGGHFDPKEKTIFGINYFDDFYYKSNKIKIDVVKILNKEFIGYKTIGGKV